MATRVAEHGGMLGSNCKAWDLSPTLWDSSVGLIRPWTLQLQQLAFVMWFSQGFDRNVDKFDLWLEYRNANLTFSISSLTKCLSPSTCFILYNTASLPNSHPCTFPPSGIHFSVQHSSLQSCLQAPCSGSYAQIHYAIHLYSTSVTPNHHTGFHSSK